MSDNLWLNFLENTKAFNLIKSQVQSAINLILPSDTTMCFWGQKWPIAAKVEINKTIEKLGELRVAKESKSAFIDFESGAFNHSATLPARDKRIKPSPPARQLLILTGGSETASHLSDTPAPS